MIKKFFKKEEHMNLIMAYQNEIIALLIILIVVYIYFKMKNKNENSSHLEDEKNLNEEIENSVEVPTTEDETFDEVQVEVTPLKESTETLLDGNEEGDFGVEEYVEEETKKEAKTKKTISKRDVPAHGKIVKDDFKEFAGERILLAEDNIINQKVILGLLADSGIEIVIANDGVETLEILENDDNFTLILMDAHMPRIDGFEATRKIRQNPNYDHILVVALSGDTAADDIKKMTEAGMTEHLEKPLKMDALYDILYAYSSDEEDRNDQNSLYNEIDIEEGMEISGDDQMFYHEILHEFLNSYKNADEMIDSYIKQNDLKHADELLLDIIGVSANIGARNLNKTAVNLKNALQKSDTKHSLLLSKFKTDLEKLLKEINTYMHQES
jgi:CheY-like chemotaxis protein